MNTLVIGDTHAPFTHPDYLGFCKDVYKAYKCERVIHIGDAVDFHASSYYESDPDGHSAGTELDLAIQCMSHWHKSFPKTDYIFGNHSRMIMRKMRSSGLPKRWARSYGEVLGLSKWKFHTRLILDGVLYIHGEGVTARTACLRKGMSVVQGHRHTESYVWYYRHGDETRFGMQVGTGIDKDSYAFAYAKDHPDPILSCGVVKDGKKAFVEPMI